MHTICTVHMCMYLTPRYKQYIHALFDTYRYAHAGSLMGVKKSIVVAVEVYVPTLYPAHESIEDTIAVVEPFPLVPPTWTYLSFFSGLPSLSSMRWILSSPSFVSPNLLMLKM